MATQDIILGGLTNAKRGLDRVLKDLTTEELKWQPKPDANSIQLILFHMAHTEDSMVQERLLGKPQLWSSEAWYQKLKRDVKDHGAHYTAADLLAFNVDVKDLLAYMDALRAKTTDYVKTLREDDFNKKITLAPMGPPPQPGAPPRPPMEIAVGSMLLMLLTHLAQHQGEISYVRGLKRGMDK